MVQLPPSETYAELQENFRWTIPDNYNIGHDICDKWAVSEPDRLAILHRQDDGTTRNITYGMLKEQSDKLAKALQTQGVQAGDRVAILLPQSGETAITHIAIYKIGAIAVPLAALFGPEALLYRLNNSGARVLVTNQAGMEKVAPLRDDIPDLHHIIQTGETTNADSLSFQALIAASDGHYTPVTTNAETPAMMIYTSGTTGPPKGALHAHRVLLGHLPGVQFSHEFFPQPGDLMWTPADWAWAGGLLNVMMPALHYGVPVVAYKFEKFNPEEAFALMADYQVRNAFIPPTALKMLRVVEAPAKRYNLALRTIGSGGESLGKETYDWAQEELGLVVNEFYGQTECNYILSSCHGLGVSCGGAIGKPVPGHLVGVIDDDGNKVPTGTLGQIAVKRPDVVMFLEYWQRPEATEAKFIGDWMITGDQGYQDEEGYVHFVGRDDDVITSAGYRIGPGEIEDCLLAHPAIALAAVIGKPDPIRTEIVKAFIVLKDGEQGNEAMRDAIQAYVRTRLSAHEYPREISFVDALPMTTTGKIIRRELRALG